MAKQHRLSRVLSASLTGLLFSTSHVNAIEWDWYGKLDLQALYTSHDLLRYADAGWQSNAMFSRLGVKAGQSINDNFSWLAVYEWQVNGLDDANRAHRLGSRNTYVGLASKRFGELTFGKNDSRFKKSEGKIDLFNETLADMAQLVPGQDRLENIVSYQSPKLGLWQWGASWQTGISDEVAGGYDWMVSYGDAGFAKAPYYLAYARAQQQASGSNLLTADRLLAQLHLGDNPLGSWTAGLMWQHSNQQRLAANTVTTTQANTGRAGTGWLASVQLKRGQTSWKLQFVTDHSRSRHPLPGQGVSAGVEHALGSAPGNAVSVYGLVTSLRLTAPVITNSSVSAPAARRDKAIAAGLRWQF
jgi:predicted porin